MGDIIRIDNSSYSRYEELLSKRDELRKKSYDYYAEYVRTFGEQILAVFQQKIECIKKKKTIEFYQQALNKGNEIDHEAHGDVACNACAYHSDEGREKYRRVKR